MKWNAKKKQHYTISVRLVTFLITTSKVISGTVSNKLTVHKMFVVWTFFKQNNMKLTSPSLDKINSMLNKKCKFSSQTIQLEHNPNQNNSNNITERFHLLSARFYFRFASFVVNAAVLGLASSLHGGIHLLLGGSLANHRGASLHCAQRQAVTWNQTKPDTGPQLKTPAKPNLSCLVMKIREKKRSPMKWGGWWKVPCERRGWERLLEKLREVELETEREEEVRERFLIWEGRVSHEHETAVAISLSLCVRKEAILSLYPLRRDDDDCYLLKFLCDIFTYYPYYPYCFPY